MTLTCNTASGGWRGIKLQPQDGIPIVVFRIVRRRRRLWEEAGWECSWMAGKWPVRVTLNGTPPLNNTAGTLRSVCLLKEGKIKRNLSKTHCFSFCYCHFNCVKSEIFTVHSESKNKKIVMDFNRALIVLHSLIALIRDESYSNGENW